MKYLTAAAIMKNERPYLSEWIEFHKKVGVEEFYLVDNGSTDGSDVLAKSHPEVKLSYLGGSAAQGRAYIHILSSYGSNANWIMFIDIDEFMVPVQVDTIPEVLKNYEDTAALLVHWRLFGSNGHVFRTRQPVVERFTSRENTVNPHVKSIVNPEFTMAYHNPHSFLHRGRQAVDENRQVITGPDPLPKDGSYKHLQVNHYATKSKTECKGRRSHPRADNGTMRDWEEFFAAHDRNDESDFLACNLWGKK